MRHALSIIALLTLGAGAAGAQSCVGLPATGTLYAAVGLEGTDGRVGSSQTLGLHRERLGVQLERETTRAGSGEQRTWDAQATWRLGDGASAREVCLVGGASHADRAFYVYWSTGAPGDVRGDYRRVRVPLGLAFGHEMYFAPLRWNVTPFVQPMVMLQHERVEGAGLRSQTRVRGALASLVGLGIASRPFVLRGSVGYAGVSEYSLDHEHNWMVLSLQAGIAF